MMVAMDTIKVLPTVDHLAFEIDFQRRYAYALVKITRLQHQEIYKERNKK